MDENEEMDEVEKAQKRLKDYMDNHVDSDSDSDDGDESDSCSNDSGVMDYLVPSMSKNGVKGAFDKLKQGFLMITARMYQSEKYLGPDIGTRYTIVPGTDVNHYETLSYGYSWIALNLNETIMVVAYTEPMCKRPADKTQVAPYAQLSVAVAEMLELKDPERSRNGQAVVFVASGAPGQECAPCLEFQDAKCAIDFLEMKLNADFSSLSPQEIQQIAVCALKYLIGPAFKPNRIDACGWGNLNGCNLLGDGQGSRMRKELVLQAINQSPLN